MKKLYLIILFMVLMHSVSWGYGIVTNTAARDTIVIPFQALDSLGSAINIVANDSIYVMVYYPGGALAFRDSMAWNDASIVRFGYEDFSDCSTYAYMELISVLDGAGGVDGVYSYVLHVDDNTSADLRTTYNGQFQVINSTLESLLDSAAFAQKAVDSLADVLDSLETMSTWIKDYFDTLIYQGPRGPGIYIDSAAGNTNTVIGTDGTSKNPVSTIAAAKTIATALGYNRYYFINKSTFNGAGTDLASDHQDWEFIGIGFNNELAFGGQRVDGARFDNLKLSGALHASGGDVLYEKCILGYISANFNGHADNCWLSDTIVMKNARNINLNDCQSDVVGNNTPTIDLSAGSSTISMTGYSGGIRIMSGAATDTMSLQTDGQIIISANNTSLNASLRGMMSVTDSGTTSNLTVDGVFNRADVIPLIWDEINTSAVHNITNSTGKQLRALRDIGIIRSNTAQAGGTNTITLDASASATDGAYDPAGIYITGGTGVGQTRNIIEYIGATKVAIVDRSWKMIPDATSGFSIFPDAGREHVNEGMAQTGSANTITLNTLASSADSAYIGQIVFIRSGVGEDQVKEITDYNGTTKVATVRGNWAVNPTDSSGYVILPFVASPDIDDIWEYDSSNVSDAAAMGTIVKNNSIPSDTNINGDTIAVVGTDQIMNLRGFHVKGTTAGDTAMIAAGNTTGQGFNVVGGNSSIGLFVEGFTSNPAVSFKQIGSGPALAIQGTGATGAADGIFIAGSDADVELDGTGKITDGTNNVFMTSDTAGLVDNIWDEDSTGHYTDPQMAFLAAQTGASGGISDADMIAITDTILGRDTSDITTGFAEMMKDTSAYQGAASGLTVDAIWEYDTANISGAQAVGSMLKNNNDSTLAALADARIGSKVWDRVANRAMVEDSAGNTTTRIQTSLTEATDNHFNDMSILFYTGAESGQMRRIDDFVGASGIVSWSAALTGIPSASDSFMVFPWTTTKADNLQSGPDTITYYTSDTSNPDVHVSDVSVWMKTISGQDYGGTQLTNTSGFVQLLGFTDDTLLIYARKLGYVWESPDTLVFAAQGSDSIMGYNVITGGSGGDSTIRIYGYAKDVISNLKQGAVPTATLVDRGFIVDTCNDIPIVQRTVTGTASNSAGLWEVYLIKSKCYKKAGIYEIKLRYKTYDEQIYRDTIPGDSSSYQIKGRRFGD